MNNIKFSIVPNKSNTKFKIAYTIDLGESSITKVLSKEFVSEDAAQEYIDKNAESLTQKIREKLSKMVIKIDEEQKETVAETVVEEVVAEETNEENNAEETVVDETNDEIDDDELVSTEIISVEEFDLNEETNDEIIDETNEETNDETVEETNGEVVALVPVITEDDEKEEEMVPRNPEKKHIPVRILSFILAAVIFFLSGYYVRKALEQNPDGSIDEPGITTPVNPGTEDEEKVLTNEEFEKLAASFIKTLQDKNVNVTTEDITKFVSIVNIDRLVEENPELAKTLFAEYSKEAYVQDSANIIGRTVQYNGKVFSEEKSTENFVRISDSLYGEQQEQVKAIESYVERVAEVYYDAEQVNAIVVELIKELTEGDLQNLDYGVQFAIQPSIELIRSYIAKDVLTEENLMALTKLTRLDVSEIMYMYDNVQGLTGTTKTLK